MFGNILVHIITSIYKNIPIILEEVYKHFTFFLIATYFIKERINQVINAVKISIPKDSKKP